MPGPAGLEPIRRKAAAPLIEEQRTQNGRTLHSAPRVKLNATARPSAWHAGELSARPILELIRGQADTVRGATDLPFFASFGCDPDLAEGSRGPGGT